MDVRQNEKKAFNKKEYRQHRYKSNFGNRQEGHGKAYLQKNAVVRQYHWMQKKEERKLKKLEKQNQIGEGESSENTEKAEPTTSNDLSTGNADELKDAFSELEKPKKKKLYSWQRAKLEYKKKIAEKEQKREDTKKRKEEMEIARKKYKEKKLHRYKKLSKKNKKGQPLMSGRIELILEKLMEEQGSK
ncbi:thyroid transcription factor 1-associated protein 26 homolog [Penaeus japonicus]|uniref:thyroid transcription factor 1-associated protein 26 homolog n=1 Tax=Penaeus japonicus TaxID=27405 RepID=UPI001C7154DE|nr:thyroid transcription factor 1-associated protein 26 homolog [Penaeus japonicus]